MLYFYIVFYLIEESLLFCTLNTRQLDGQNPLRLSTGKVTWSDEMYTIFGLDRASFSHDSEAAIALSVHPEDRKMLSAVNAAVRNDGIPRLT